MNNARKALLFSKINRTILLIIFGLFKNEKSLYLHLIYRPLPVELENFLAHVSLITSLSFFIHFNSFIPEIEKLSFSRRSIIKRSHYLSAFHFNFFRAIPQLALKQIPL